jgi:gamma-butyrobetaine dioxygenase
MNSSVDTAIHLSHIEPTDAGLFVRWSDESVSFFHHIWLRDNCRCSACGEPSIGRRTLRLSGIPREIIAISTAIDRDDALTINWSDGHQSSYAGAWLKTYTYNEDARSDRVFSPPIWTEETRQNPPILSFRGVQQDLASFREMLLYLRDFGICFLHDAPPKDGTLEELASRIGPVQESNFGRVQDMVVDRTERGIANDVDALKPHTDEPYRASPPGILLFHCIQTDVTGGGSSIFLDGFEIAETLRIEDPEAFTSLTRNRQAFRRHISDDVDLIAEFPIISLDEFDNICGVRINDRVAAPLSIPSREVSVYYRGLRRLLELAEDSKRMIRRALKPGDIALFDNHRVLHGRTTLTVHGRRWLQWAQVERGDFHSTLRITADRLQLHRDALPLLRGAYG